MRHFVRVLENLVNRVSGPMYLRLILQPVMSIIFAVRDGIKDAREGSPPYLWSILTDPTARHEQIIHGWKSAGRIFILALVLDAVYQIVSLGWFYPGEALMVAITVAFVPYLLVRGPINRVACWFMHRRRL